MHVLSCASQLKMIINSCPLPCPLTPPLPSGNIKFLKEIAEKKAKLKSKREEVERKARRGEIDPMHEHAIQNISQVEPKTIQ